MDSSRIAELLQSYIVGLDPPPGIYDQLGAYLALLLRWNAKTNLTAIREPEQIVTRHFGESLFAAGVLFGSQASGAPSGPGFGSGGNDRSTLRLSSRADHERSRGAAEGPALSDSRQLTTDTCPTTLADLGSGAGFPGIPIKLAFPELCVTLLESQNKKVTFLREVIRALQLDGIEVYRGRAEQWGKQADAVTLRAVEKFESVLPVAAGLVAPAGRLCLLIGESQSGIVRGILDGFDWQVGTAIDNVTNKAIMVGIRPH